MDDLSWRLIEVENLMSVIDHTKTKVGHKTLYRSLANPLMSPRLIKAKQDSLRELDNDVSMKASLSGYLDDLVE